MEKQTNNDPILRVVLIVFAGLLVFGFLFGFNFGGTGQATLGHHGGVAAAGGGGYYFGSLIAGLISFLINILTLVMVFALIAGLFIGVKKFLATQQDNLMETSRSKVMEARSKVMDAVNQDPVLKTLLMVIVGIAGFYFIIAVFHSFDAVGYGFSPYYMLFALVGLLLKLLMIGLVVALVMALVQYLKSQFDDGQSRQEINVTPATTPQAPAIAPHKGKPEDKDKFK